MDMLDIEGAWLFTPRIHVDRRGSFHEWFQGKEIADVTGRQFDVAQANCSISQAGVIRGIHVSDVPPGQAKYITCISGAVLDVIVDLRVSSPGFGRWTAVQLDEDGRQAVLLSEGLGHAFAALSDMATMIYLCSTPYAPERERGVHPLDPDLAIAWPQEPVPILSDRDAAAPSLAQARAAGLLPA